MFASGDPLSRPAHSDEKISYEAKYDDYDNDDDDEHLQF